MITRYAWFDAAVIVAAGAVVSVVVFLFLGWWGIVPAVFTLAVLMFYRDPPRRVPDDPRVVVAPADGKIVAIERDFAGEGGRPELRIVIFLSVLDVHVNRSPCPGVVRAVEYRPGQFLNALRDECNECNERNTLVIDPEPPIPGPVTVRQIAGALARRIVCAVRVGDRLGRGERFGMIKLGSRTELRLAEDSRWQVLVRPGQHVNGGRSVLARLEQ